jgi:cobalt ECF transporter T component CbiQ
VSRSGFIERTLNRFARAMAKALLSERTAAMPGLLQALDPRVRLVGLLTLVISVILCRRLEAIAALWLLAVVIAIASRVSMATLALRVWLLVFVFTGLIAFPAVFLTPGNAMFSIGSLSASAQGLRTAALLILRVETAATLTTILVLCTPWAHILKSLRNLGVPVEVIAILAMTHRYIFLLVETASQMFEARQSRAIGRINTSDQRNLTSRTAGVLLGKSIELSHEVYAAMLSRGFRGEVRLLTNFRMQFRDYCALAMFVCAAGFAVWMGR